MSTVDDKLAAWKRATGQLEPQEQTLARLAKLASQGGAAAAGAKAGLGLKLVVAVIVGGAIGAGTWVALTPREPRREEPVVYPSAQLQVVVPAESAAPVAVPVMGSHPMMERAATGCEARRAALSRLVKTDPKGAAAELARWTLQCGGDAGMREAPSSTP